MDVKSFMLYPLGDLKDIKNIVSKRKNNLLRRGIKDKETSLALTCLSSLFEATVGRFAKSSYEIERNRSLRECFF